MIYLVWRINSDNKKGGKVTPLVKMIVDSVVECKSFDKPCECKSHVLRDGGWETVQSL